MTCTITSRGFELLLALQIAPPERFPKNALSILKCNLLEILCALVEKGYTDFYVNGAYGIPFWSAEMICALKLYHPALRLHLVQPYPEHNAGWKPELRDRIQQILEKADEVFCAEPEETADCYEAADRIMCSASDLLVIFGTRSANRSMVSYAGMQDVPVFSLKWENLLIP